MKPFITSGASEIFRSLR